MDPYSAAYLCVLEAAGLSKHASATALMRGAASTATPRVKGAAGGFFNAMRSGATGRKAFQLADDATRANMLGGRTYRAAVGDFLNDTAGSSTRLERLGFRLGSEGVTGKRMAVGAGIGAGALGTGYYAGYQNRPSGLSGAWDALTR